MRNCPGNGSANITQIFKNENKEEPLNYRPVSLTSVVCKICEKIIRKRWVDMLDEREVLTNKQFGFRKGCSCTTNLISYYDRVVDIVQERDGWVDCIYLDMKKAFDTVPHKRLLWKMKNIGGVEGKLLKWMGNYLLKREMRTVIKGKFSTWNLVTSGVPQGSVIAPIMFLVFINDLPVGLDSYVSLFADDAKIMRQIRNRNDCEELQNDLNKLHNWNQTWKMQFNTNKCHVLEMGKSKNRPSWDYKLGNESISKARKEKDLGIIISDDLSPEHHINKITGEAYSVLTRNRIALNYLDEEMLRKIIETVIRPRLEYAAVVWSPNLKKHIVKIERVQRVATKMLTSLKDLPYEERLERLNLPTLKERRERGDMIMMFRCVKGFEKVDKVDFVIKDEGRTRGHDFKLRKGVCRSDARKYSFPYRSIEGWNGLDGEVVGARNIQAFKIKMDKCRERDRTTRA